MEHDAPCPRQLCLKAIPTTHKLFPNPPADVSPRSGTPEAFPGSAGSLVSASKTACPFSGPGHAGPGSQIPPRSPSNPSPPPSRWADPDPLLWEKGLWEGLTQLGCKSVGWRHVLQPLGCRAVTAGSQDPPHTPQSILLPLGQGSRGVSGSWSHPERDKARPVPQMKGRLGVRPQPGCRASRSRGTGLGTHRASDPTRKELSSWAGGSGVTPGCLA